MNVKAALVCALVAGSALAASPQPEFPKDGVAVSGVPDLYDGLRRFLKSFESKSGAKFYVAVVQYTDPANRLGQQYGEQSRGFAYLNALTDDWAQDADRADGVIVLMSMGNRDIAAHPFAHWTRLGWEKDEVKRTIDASGFASLARAGDYPAALQTLIRDIDAELAQRAAEERRATERAQRLIANTRGLDDNYEAALTKLGFAPKDAVTLHQSALQEVERAEHALQNGDAHAAEGFAYAASTHALKAVNSAAYFKKDQQDLEERATALEEKLQETAARLSGSGVDAEAAAGQLEEARARLEDGRAAIAATELTRAGLALGAGDQKATAAGFELEAALSMHRFRTRTLPLAFLGALLLAFLVWLAVRAAQLRTRKAAASELVQEWERLLRTAAENLMKLLDEHALLLGEKDLVQRYAGKTQGPVTEAARAVDEVFLSYECAQRRLEEAKRIFDKPGALAMFRATPWSKVEALLTRDEVVARTEDVKEHALFLPDRREVKLRPQALLQEMERAFQDAQRKVVQLSVELAASFDDVERAKKLAAAVVQANRSLEEQLRASPFRGELDALETRCREVVDRGRTDPLGAREDAQALERTLSEWKTRIDRTRDALARARTEAVARREEARGALMQLRNQGLRVGEPGFEPEAMLSRITRALAACEDAARAGRDAQAQEASVDALDTASELARLVARTEQSRERSPAELQALRARLTDLRTRLPERRDRLRQLAQEHADSALQPALDNAEEAQGVLAQADAALTEAASCLSESAQRYLAAAELCARAKAAADAVDGLYAEIDTKAEALAEQRRVAEAAIDHSARALSETAALLGTEDAFATQDAVKARTDTAKALEALRQTVAAARPDWVSARVLAESLAVTADGTLATVRAQKHAYDEAQALVPELQTRAKAYGELLRSRDDDRPATNQEYQQALQTLADARALAKKPHADWTQVIAGLRKAAAGLETTKQMAERDFADAAKVRAELAGAERTITSADSWYGHGITADLSSSRRYLTLAQQFLLAHEFDNAMNAARKARHEADEARIHAISQVDAYQSRSSYRTSSSSSFFGSSSGSSFGSSFGGSSSGGSSFGSSSGGSSFSSSSGGSSW